MQRALVRTSDWKKLHEELRPSGGRVTHVLAPRRLAGECVVWVPDALDVSQLRHCVTGSASSSDKTTTSLLKAARRWLQDAASRPLQALESTAPAPLWTASSCLRPRAPATKAEALKVKPFVCDCLSGTVAIGLVTISGPKDLAITLNQEVDILTGALRGMSDLIEAEPSVPLTFVIEHRRAKVTEKGTRDCEAKDWTKDQQDCINCERLWLDPLLKDLGFKADFPGIEEFREDLVRRLECEKGCLAFFTEYSVCSTAYATPGGPHLVIGKMAEVDEIAVVNWTFGHELCHVFYAFDEYGACRCAEAAGVFSTPNGNCVNCPSGTQLCCVMDKNTRAICRWTRRQMGWPAWTVPQSVKRPSGVQGEDEVAFGGQKLRIEQRGSELWYAIHDGHVWLPDISITEQNGAQLEENATPPLLALEEDLPAVYYEEAGTGDWKQIVYEPGHAPGAAQPIP